MTMIFTKPAVFWSVSSVVYLFLFLATARASGPFAKLLATYGLYVCILAVKKFRPPPFAAGHVFVRLPDAAHFLVFVCIFFISARWRCSALEMAWTWFCFWYTAEVVRCVLHKRR